MAITDYIPNVFGSAAPTTYEGLLGMGLITPEQMKKQQNVANIQGLLGAGLALAQGMSKIGPRRSAAENVLGALSGGFGAAGGAYQQGLQNIVQQQQLQSAALTQKQTLDRAKAIEAAKLKYPDLAELALIDPGKFAEEVALKERIKGIETTTKEVTPESLRAEGQKLLLGGAPFAKAGETKLQQADTLELTNLTTLTGNETVDELRQRASRAIALKSKEAADYLIGVANAKQLQGGQVLPSVTPAAAPIEQAIVPAFLQGQRVVTPQAVTPAPKAAAQVSPLDAQISQKRTFEQVIAIYSRPEFANNPVAQKALENARASLPIINEEIKRLRASQISKLTGNETPAQLRTLALEADELGNKSLADNLLAIASRKELEPPVPTEPKPEDLVKQEMAKRAEMPQALVRTKGGSILNAKPNWEAGEEYVDEELNKKFRPVTELPPTEVVADRGRVGQLQRQIDETNKEIVRLSAFDTELADKKVNRLIKIRDGLQSDLNRFSIMEYDFKSIKEGLPKKYQSEVADIEKLVQTGTLDAAGLRSSIEKFYTRLQEDEKGRKLEGNAATFAQMKFGVTDRAQLTGQQLAEVLRFENAPTAQQIAQLEQANKQLTLDNIKTQFETGRGIGTVPTIPTGREDLLTAPSVVSTAVPTVAPAVNTAAITPTAADVTQTTPVVTGQVAPVTTNQVATTTQRVAPRVATDAAPRVVTETAPRVSPENSPPQTRGLYKYNKDALINQPDSKFPPRQKVELRAKKAASASAVNYGLTAIVDARDAALALRNNPVYIEALTGRTSPFRTQTFGGVVVDRDAYTAGQLLENILTRTFVKEIQEMRNASPTGSALGNSTEKEMTALSKVAAALSVGMNKDALIRELDNYLRIADRSIITIPTAYAKTYGYAGEFDDLLTRITINPTPVVPRPSGQRRESGIPLDVRRRYGLQ